MATAVGRELRVALVFVPDERAFRTMPAVDAGAPNLRLPLGADAVGNIRSKLGEITAGVEATEAVASAWATTPA
jgi:hypothetical protein